MVAHARDVGIRESEAGDQEVKTLLSYIARVHTQSGLCKALSQKTSATKFVGQGMVLAVQEPEFDP